MQKLYARGQVSLEGEWGHDEDWEATEYATAWLRMKVDSLVFISDTEAVVIDYKSGKKFGNEVKHAQQTQLYQLATFLRYPQLDTVHTELWYTDQNELTQQTYTRSQGLRFKANWDKQFKAMTSCTEFPKNPNAFSCRWCYYGTKKAESTGHCDREA